MCLKSIQFFKPKLADERYLWHENIRELKSTVSTSNPELHPIESEPLSKTPITETSYFLNVNGSDLGDYIKEADFLLGRSLSEMVSVAEKDKESFDNNNQRICHVKAEPVELPPPLEHLEVATEPEETIAYNMDGITDELIVQMTDDLAKILPSEGEEAQEEGKKTSIKKKKPKNRTSKSLPKSYQRKIKIDLKASKVINMTTVPVSKKSANLRSTKVPTANPQRGVTELPKFRLIPAVFCTKCNKKFANNSELALHMMSKHKKRRKKHRKFGKY